MQLVLVWEPPSQSVCSPSRLGLQTRCSNESQQKSRAHKRQQMGRQYLLDHLSQLRWRVAGRYRCPWLPELPVVCACEAAVLQGQPENIFEFRSHTAAHGKNCSKYQPLQPAHLCGPVFLGLWVWHFKVLSILGIWRTTKPIPIEEVQFIFSDRLLRSCSPLSADNEDAAQEYWQSLHGSNKHELEGNLHRKH